MKYPGEWSVKFELTSLSRAYAPADLAESTSKIGQFRSAGPLDQIDVSTSLYFLTIKATHEPLPIDYHDGRVHSLSDD
jgi:hypothetical protein